MGKIIGYLLNVLKLDVKHQGAVGRDHWGLATGSVGGRRRADDGSLASDTHAVKLKQEMRKNGVRN